MKPSELYAMRPVSIHRSTDEFNRVHVIEEFLEGVDSYLISDETKIEGIEFRYYADEDFDGNRGWELFSVWFLGRPVMIVRKAGRGMRDHTDHFITDYEHFTTMCKYMRSLMERHQNDNEDVVDPEVDIPDLVNFYSNKLEHFYNPDGVDPKYIPGDILLVKVRKTHNSYTDISLIETRVRVHSVNPFHPTETYSGRQIDRRWCTEKGRLIHDPDNGYAGASFDDSDVVKLIERPIPED